MDTTEAERSVNQAYQKISDIQKILYKAMLKSDPIDKNNIMLEAHQAIADAYDDIVLTLRLLSNIKDKTSEIDGICIRAAKRGSYDK